MFELTPDPEVLKRRRAFYKKEMEEAKRTPEHLRKRAKQKAAKKARKKSR